MIVPKFVLFDASSELVAEWRQAFAWIVPEKCLDDISIVDGKLGELEPPNLTFDCIVSPANSFARFDGGFDAILASALSYPSEPSTLTRIAQAVMYDRWRGFAPPGTCTLIPLLDTPCAANKFACRFVALCPTMRFPGSVSWHKEIVYNCVWSLLAAIDEHNKSVVANGRAPIEKVAMTGLATGVGQISAKQCAKQMALAFAHYYDAKTNPEKWSALEWGDIMEYNINVHLPMDY